MGKSKSSIPFQIVQAVLKHPNYPDSLGTAVLINSTGEKQKLSAVGLWTVMAKTKELTEDLRLRIVAAHKSGKGYKTISKCFEVPVATVQSVIKKFKTFHTVKNLRGLGWKPKVTPVLARRIVRGKKESKDHHQGHPDESGLVATSQGIQSNGHCTPLGSTDADQGGHHFSR
ncbi:hypothetical protein QTP86_008182 [Hemibagrus guttatus]|nr:hypothetical protein QTP86_008182 [Hemibagrus guttatus]